MAKKNSKTKSVSTKKTAGKSSMSEKPTVSFDYIKSNQFRVIRVDGVHGGVSPKGNVIQMALFSERAPIPKRETYRIENGKLRERTASEQRDAFIREVEVEVLVDLATAKAMHKWLGEKIESAEQIGKEGKTK